MLVLGIETSCDETAAAVVENGRRIRSNVVASQHHVHSRFGGVVPELACRKHIESISWIIAQALKRAGTSLDLVDALAVTVGPGLAGALLVGISTAKAMAYARGIPLIGVNHLEGHICSIFLDRERVPFPFIALVVSGGHTGLFQVRGLGQYRLLGQTRDDAAGEAFDKVAKMLNLGYPGGPVIDRLAQGGDAKAVNFPRAYLGKDSLEFSFSGLKTAVLLYLKAHFPQHWDPKRGICRLPFLTQGEEKDLSQEGKDILASFQQAAVDMLVYKTLAAARQERLRTVVVTGGVASNHLLRQALYHEGRREGIRIFFPSPQLCTDNAAMIACAGYHALLRERGNASDPHPYLQMDAQANLSLGIS